MLTLNDGRSELWQWDTKRKLTVDADCSQVHFSNKVFGRSNDVDVIDGIAIIPDILLQTDKDLTAWAFVGTAENGYTKISKTFKVNKRNKPADYVFTPTEQTSLEEIKEKIEYLESIQDPDAIKNAVEDYLEQNPVDAPVQSVNGKTGKVSLTALDVGAISQDDLQEATNEALAQAKASGEFKGDPGKDYVLTEDDKTEIAEMAAGMVDIPEQDSGGNAVQYIPQELTDEQKAQARENIGVKNGYSIYYADRPYESLEPVFVRPTLLSNNGDGIKIGDIVIFSNGTLSEVIEVVYRDDGSWLVRCVPKSNIGNPEQIATESYDNGETANVKDVTSVILHGKTVTEKSKKNLCSVNRAEVSTTDTIEIEEIPAGTYTISFLFTTTDTDSSCVGIIFCASDGTQLKDMMLDRGTGGNRTFGSIVANKPISKLVLYASYGWQNSNGDTAVYEDIMIESGWSATEYEPYNTVAGISAEVSFDDLVFSADAKLLDGDTVDFVSGEVIRADGAKETVAVQGDASGLSGKYVVATENTVDITYRTVPYVLFTKQSLTKKEQARAAENIGAMSAYFNPSSTHIPSVPNGTIITNCQNIDDWNAILGTKKADVGDRLIGTQSVQFSHRIQYKAIDVPIKNKEFRIKFKVNDWGDAETLELYVTNNNFDTFDYALIAAKNDLHAFVKVGEWVDVVVPLSAFKNGVIHSLENVTTIRLTTNNENCSMNVQQVSVVDAPTQKGVISFAFDDGYVSNFTKAAPILAENGIPATAYIIPRAIDAGLAEFLSEDQTLKLKQLYGWDIECHLSENMGNLSTEEMVEELAYAKQWIQERGLGTGDHFAYPEGYYDATVENICRKYFATSRTIDNAGTGGINSLHLPNPHRLRAVSSVGNSYGGYTVSLVQTLVDRVSACGGWLILVFHHIDDENTSSGMYCSSSALREIAEYVVSSGVEIRTVADALR